MAFRTPEKQREHDLVLGEILKTHWPSTGGKVYSNPGAERNCYIQYKDSRGRTQFAYPDIVSLMRGTNSVRCVGEVETDDTVTQIESGQWKLYADVAGHCFLYVPRETAAVAKALVGGMRGVSLRCYFVDENGILNVVSAH